MRYSLLLTSMAMTAASLHALPYYALIGGGDNNTGAAYAATVSPSAEATPIEGLPASGFSFIQSVAMNGSGMGIIGGEDDTGPNAPYAAFVSPSGTLIPIINPLTLGTLLSVDINASGTGIIGGADYTVVSDAYAAFVSPSGNVTALTGLPSNGVIRSVAINDSGAAVVGGQRTGPTRPYAAIISPSTTAVFSLTLPASSGDITSVDINSSGTAIIGGRTGGFNAYAAFISPSGTVSAFSLPPFPSTISGVAINSSGTALIGGSNGLDAYAAFVSSSGNVTPIADLPSPGSILHVAMNSSGDALVAGFSSDIYAALISPLGVVTPLSNLPAGGTIDSVAINSFGAGIIGGDDGAGAFAALVTPTGALIFIPNLPSNGYITDVALLDLIPTDSLTGNNLIFANYINEFAPQDAFYFGPSFVNGTLSDALESAAPTRNAFSLYTASNNLFYLSTSLATHLRSQHLIQRRREASMSYAARISEREDQLLASNSLLAKQGAPAKTCCCEEEELPYTVWFDALGALAYQKAQNQTPAFNPATGGGILSFDAKVSENTRAGISLTYLFTHIHEKKGAGSSNINQEDLFLYASWENCHFYVDGAVGGGLFQIDQVRNIHMVGFEFKSSSHPDGWQLIPHFEFGYHDNFNSPNCCCVRDVEIYCNPFVMLDWANAWQSGYSEKGSGPFNVRQKHHYSSLLRTEVGLRFYETLFYDTWNLILLEKASYVNAHSFGTGRVNAFLIGSPGSFTVSTLTSDQNLGVVQLAATFDPLNRSYPITTLFYQGEFGTMYQAHEVNLELSWNF